MGVFQGHSEPQLCHLLMGIRNGPKRRSEIPIMEVKNLVNKTPDKTEGGISTVTREKRPAFESLGPTSAGLRCHWLLQSLSSHAPAPGIKGPVGEGRGVKGSCALRTLNSGPVGGHCWETLPSHCQFTKDGVDPQCPKSFQSHSLSPSGLSHSSS